MPTEIEAMLGPEITKRAKAIIEAAGPDHDWGPLIRAVDAMMEGAAELQGIDFETLEKISDEGVQLLKVRPPAQKETK